MIGRGACGGTCHDELNPRLDTTTALFSLKKVDFGTVVFLFLFNKYCPIMD